MTLHDYFSACPRANLVDASQSYCGEPAVEACSLCVATSSSKAGVVSVSAWRRVHGALLSGARSVFAPSHDLAERMAHYFPTLSFTVRPHWVTDGGRRLRMRQSETPTFAVIGAIDVSKGSHVLLKLVSHAKVKRPDVNFVLIGYSDIDEALKATGNITITGRYAPDALPDLLEQHRANVLLALSVWPESFCYAFHEGVELGLYPIAFDIGAPADAIRQSGWGTVMPLSAAYRPEELLDRILAADRHQPAPLMSGVMQREAYRPLLVHYYGLRLDTQPEARVVSFPEVSHVELPSFHRRVASA